MIPRVSCLCLTRWVLKNWFSNRACIKKLQKISLRLFLHWLLSWTCEIFSQSLNILVICSVLLTGYVSYVRPSGLNGLIVLLAELSFLLCFNPNWSSTKVSSLILIDLPNTILPNTRALLQTKFTITVTRTLNNTQAELVRLRKLFIFWASLLLLLMDRRHL